MQGVANSPVRAVESGATPYLDWVALAENSLSLDEAVLSVGEVYAFGAHPYLLWMQAPGTSRAAFRRSQLPFRFAVEAFSQALAAVLARMPVLEQRLALVDNIWEEHGRGSSLRSHKSTFQHYLQALGATATELQSPCSLPVLAFNQSILNYCLTQAGEAGAALLGTIEYLYIEVSAAIARTLHQRHWATVGSQAHYTLHEKLDVEHAQELLRLAQPAWNDPRSCPQVAQALTLGAYYFWTLYNGLLL